MSGSKRPARSRSSDPSLPAVAGRASSPPPPPPRPAPTTRIHARGEGRLDQVLDFVQFVGRPMPLSVLLDEGPRRIAEIVGADVASLYLPEGARGVVRLAVGEGITGMAVECMRPISVIQAPEHANYRAFPELDEDRYP